VFGTGGERNVSGGIHVWTGPIHVQLIFWGCGWAGQDGDPTSDATHIITALSAIATGPYFSGLSQYHRAPSSASVTSTPLFVTAQGTSAKATFTDAQCRT
jgi:hypothetical protein